MLSPRMDSIPQDPSVPVTGGLHSIGKDVFVSPFPKPSTLWITRATLTGLSPVPIAAPSRWRVIAVFIL